MKKLMSLVFILLSFSIVHGGEVTGAGFVKNIMKKRQMNLEQMLNNGHDLLLGEVTGAGRKVPLSQIKVLVTKEDAFKMSNIQRIEFKKSGGLKLENVDFFEIKNKVIDVSELKALVIEKKK